MSSPPPEALSDDENLARCEAVLGYTFRDRDFLRHGLTHSSVSMTRLESNERMEFLGDAVLGMIVCEWLYANYGEFPEGELTRIKSSVVSRSTCAKVARDIGLDDCLYLGKGLTTHDEIPESVIAGSFEAVVAAIYLDGGYDAARTFLLRVLIDEIERLAEQEEHENFKSLLQQLAQRDLQMTPIYTLLDEKGPDHSKCFKVAAVIGDTTYPAAWGTTKKEAEQRAAENAFYVLEQQPPPYPSDE
jgi:ribonuclease-3